MERDPVRFVWRSAPGLNICLLALALLAIPSLWVVLDLIRAAIDDAALGRAFRDGRSGAFMRFALVLPDRIAEGPLVLVPGFSLSRAAMVKAKIDSGRALAGILRLKHSCALTEEHIDSLKRDLASCLKANQLLQGAEQRGT